MTSLAKINELISTFSNRSYHQTKKKKLQICDAWRNLSFATSTTLIEYTDDYFSKNVPDGCYISGTFDIENDWIIVYQAFNKNIAEYAVKHQDFLGNDKYYNPKRMTWIKPNFLWMQYRANWAQKDKNQTNILAIWLKLSDDGFINLVKHSNVQKNKKSDNRVNLQWDPHHRPNREKIVSKRAIQLGVRGTYSIHRFHGNIIRIEDITPFVQEQYEKLQQNKPILVPLETVLDINEIKGENKLESTDIERIKLGKSW